MKAHHSQDGEYLRIVSCTLSDAFCALSKSRFLWLPSRKGLHLQESRDQNTLSLLCRKFGTIVVVTELLPELGDYFDSLLWGNPGDSPSAFTWLKTKKDSRDPIFLQAIWREARLLRKRVETGYCPTNEDVRFVRSTRTFLLGCKKLAVPPSEVKIQRVLDRFAGNEKHLKEFHLGRCATSVLQTAREVANAVLPPHLGKKRHCLDVHHGPGAVAGGEKGNEKWRWKPLPDRYARFGVSLFETREVTAAKPEHPSWGNLKGLPASIRRQFNAGWRVTKVNRTVPLGPQAPLDDAARLLWVPKDSRGPRLIACEPKETMWLQQGYAEMLKKHFETHPLTKGQINFTSQEVNRNLALVSSRSRENATLDLSDASDLVSVNVLEILLADRSDLLQDLLCLRSSRLSHNGRLSPKLQKYAMMGSALCFPVEAFVFWCVSVAALSRRGVAQAHTRVWVYGDDIIVPNKHAQSVAEDLEAIGLRVNRGKSFMGSEFFRESCGMDAFIGNQVSPLRLRKLVPSDKTDGQSLSAYVDYANQAIEAGFERRAGALREVVQKRLGEIPVVEGEHSFLHFLPAHDELPSLRGARTRWIPCPDDPRKPWTQTLEVYAPRLVVSKGRQSPLEDVERLLRDLVIDLRERDPNSVSTVSAAVTVVPSWCPFRGAVGVA